MTLDRKVQPRKPLVSNKESMTIQSHAAESDINYIVRRYQRDGIMPSNPRGQEPQYIDCTNLQGDLTEKMVDAAEAVEVYNQLSLKEKTAKEKREAEERKQFQDWKKSKESPTPPFPAGSNSQPVGETGASPKPPDTQN